MKNNWGKLANSIVISKPLEQNQNSQIRNKPLVYKYTWRNFTLFEIGTLIGINPFIRGIYSDWFQLIVH